MPEDTNHDRSDLGVGLNERLLEHVPVALGQSVGAVGCHGCEVGRRRLGRIDEREADDG